MDENHPKAASPELISDAYDVIERITRSSEKDGYPLNTVDSVLDNLLTQLAMCYADQCHPDRTRRLFEYICSVLLSSGTPTRNKVASYRVLIKELELESTDAGATALSFSADGTWLAFVVPYQGLRFWRWGVGGKPAAPAGTGDVRSAVFSPTAALLLTASNSGVVRAWKISNGEAAPELQQAWAAAPCAESVALVLSRDGSLAAAGCEDCSS